MSDASIKKGPGRPKSIEGPKPTIAVRIKPALLRALDKWAAKKGYTRTGAIEIMIQAGLKK